MITYFSMEIATIRALQYFVAINNAPSFLQFSSGIKISIIWVGNSFIALNQSNRFINEFIDVI